MALGFGQPLLRDEDFLTDKITTVLYPPGAGGKFLSACLGLSRHSCLNDKDTIALQCRKKKFSQQQKFDLLISRLQAVDEMWADMGLAFIGPHDHFNQYPTELKRYFIIHKELVLQVRSGLWLFSEMAFANKMDWEYKIWPNTRVIGFINAFEFINQHRPRRFHPNHWQYSHDLNVFYDTIRQSGWPEGPPQSQQQLNHEIWNSILTLEQKNQMIELTYDEDFLNTWYRLEQSNIIKQTQRAQYHKFWDTFAYTNQEHFLHELQGLYDWFGFDDYNIDLLSQLYCVWHEKSKDK